MHSLLLIYGELIELFYLIFSLFVTEILAGMKQ